MKKLVCLGLTVFGIATLLPAQKVVLNKKETAQSYTFNPGDTVRAFSVIVPEQNLVNNMPCLKPALEGFNMPNLAYTPGYKAVMWNRYGNKQVTGKPLLTIPGNIPPGR